MESASLEGNWYVLYTRNKQERLARESLPYESVVPMIERKIVKRASDESQIAMIEMEPKYPNYVFVKHNGDKDFFEVCLRSRFVVSFAGGNFDAAKETLPNPLSKEDVDRIFEKEIQRDLAPGDMVLVIDGPYKEQVGILQIRENGYCRISFKVFNITLEELIPEEFVTKHG